MDKLQYDSFYKFLVSLGIILITLPIVALVFVVNCEPILISQSEFDVLSEFSQNSVQQKESVLSLIVTWLPICAQILIPIGVGCLLYGGIRWHLIQLQLDDQVKSDTIMKKINAQNMNASQIVTKAAGEVTDAESNEEAENPPQQKFAMAGDKIIKYMQIEDLCYAWAERKYSRKYHLKKHVRIGNWDYDFVAVSKKNDSDLLFEVKYWKQLPPTQITSSLLYKMFTAEKNYETETHRNIQSIIIIVTPKQNLEKMQERLAKRIEIRNMDCSAEIQYLAEEELTQFKS